MKIVQRKSERAAHDWQITGTERVDVQEWAQIRCRRCSEQRVVGASLDAPAVRYGCWRTGPDRFQIDDLVVVKGGGLDRIVSIDGDQIATYNAGGHYRLSVAADLHPY